MKQAKLKQAPVPEYDFTREQQKNVYLPDEDTFLLMDAIYNFCDVKVNSALEIGPGSGVVITFTALNFQLSTYKARDVNPTAVQMTNETLVRNKLSPNCELGDMFTDLNQKYDLVIFNPPYCVGTCESLGVIDKALSGGANGREQIDKFIKGARGVVSEGGLAFMVAISANDIKDIIKCFDNEGMQAEVVLEKKLPSEHLHVLKIQHQK
ncbi:Glutamine_methyltransferase [Hexamita inflata]|uniref:Glutamine_methyltransferase n=1 Tax=Hexamita inflata TaxID=28002 RepID=A0ABP1HC70_9EUKA